MTLEDEVEKSFEENPHLVRKSLREIAIFFMVQGELRYSLLRQTLNHKADFFLSRLYDLDASYAEKMEKEWAQVAEIYSPKKKKALEEAE